VCELLNTTGTYYVRGKNKNLLIIFLAYFQRYLLAKETIPLHVEFMILDCLDNLEELAKEALREKEGHNGTYWTIRKKQCVR
jgi:hypothetical protein